jgi:hypothetical protein
MPLRLGTFPRRSGHVPEVRAGCRAQSAQLLFTRLHADQPVAEHPLRNRVLPRITATIPISCRASPGLLAELRDGGISRPLQVGTSESWVVEHFKTKSPSQSERPAQRQTPQITRESGGSQIALGQCERGELGRFGCDPVPAIRGALSCFSASVLRLSPAFTRAVPVA